MERVETAARPTADEHRMETEHRTRRARRFDRATRRTSHRRTARACENRCPAPTAADARERSARRRGRPSPTDAARRPRPLMTERASTRLRVACTECDFETTLVRSAEGWSADAVADHAERTGHTLRSTPLDG